MAKMKANPDAEIGVLSTLIEDGNPSSLLVKKSMMNLHEGLFYNPNNRELFNLIKKFCAAEQPFDAITLLSRALDAKIHEMIEFAVLGNYISSNLLDYHIDELNKQFELRSQLAILSKASKECLEEPITSKASDIMMDGIKRAGNASVARQKQGLSFLDISKVDEHNQFINQSIIECGINQFETIKNCSLITIAGASGVGKTFFSIYVMDQIARFQSDKQILFFSLEMKCNEIWERYLHLRNLSKQESHQLPQGKVFDQTRIDIDYIETISHLEALNKPLSVIVIDYLALVTSKGKFDREDLRLSDVTQRLSALALNLNCVVILLSQVNRNSSKRPKEDRCPYPEDVADSIGSVRSSSLWIGIDRPETYDNAPDKRNLFIAKCRKSRFGNNFEAWFDFNNGRFVERNKVLWRNVSKNSFNQFVGDIKE